MSRPNKNKCHGISIIEPVNIGWNYSVMFNHPLLNRRRIRRSLGTSDGKIAKDIANKLSILLYQTERHLDLKDVDERVKKIWSTQPRSTAFPPLVAIKALKTLKEIDSWT